MTKYVAQIAPEGCSDHWNVFQRYHGDENETKGVAFMHILFSRDDVQTVSGCSYNLVNKYVLRVS